MYYGLFFVSCIIANIHATAWIMFFIPFLPYIGEYILSLYTLKHINYISIKKNEKKLKQIKPNNVEKIKCIEEKIKHSKEFIENYKGKENVKIIINQNHNAIWLPLIMLITSLAALITPIGDVPYTYVLRTSLGKSLTYINEHLPIVIGCNLVFFSYTVIVFALFGFTDSKIRLSDAFLVLGLYLMTICAKRNLYLLVSLTAVPITKMINDFLNKNLEIDYSSKRHIKILNGLFIITGVIVLGFSIYFYLKNKDGEYINSSMYPVEAANWIKENLDIDTIKLYNEYDFGSYLLWQGIPVFLDSRCDLYTPQFNKNVTVFDDYMTIKYGNEHYQKIIEKYGITHAIVYKDSIENTYMKLDENCKKIYEDESFIVYEYNSVLENE